MREDMTRQGAYGTSGILLWGACATVVIPASMCEDMVKDCHLEHRAIGGDMQLQCRLSTASVTTRDAQA
jgi:hypothetical protein